MKNPYPACLKKLIIVKLTFYQTNTLYLTSMSLMNIIRVI